MDLLQPKPCLCVTPQSINILIVLGHDLKRPWSTHVVFPDAVWFSGHSFPQNVPTAMTNPFPRSCAYGSENEVF